MNLNTNSSPNIGSPPPQSNVSGEVPVSNSTSSNLPTLEESMGASRKISNQEAAKVSGGRALLGALFTGLSNIATLPVNIASFILGGAAGKACGKTQEGREGATLALGLTIGLPFTLAGLGLSLIATALKNSEKPNFQDTFKDAFMNSNRLNFSSRLHEAAEKDLNQGMAELVEDFNKENLSTARDADIPESPLPAQAQQKTRWEAAHEIKDTEEAIQWIKNEGITNRMALSKLSIEMRNTKNVVAAAVEFVPENFEYASEELKDDFDIAKQAVSKKPNLLRELGPNQKQNDEILKIGLIAQMSTYYCVNYRVAV